MSAITFRSVAAGMVTRLTDQLDYLRTCRFYAGEESDLTEVAPPYESPACFVLFERLEMPGEMQVLSGTTAARAVYAAVIVAKTTGGRSAAAEDDEHSAHAIIEDVISVLVGDDLSLAGFTGLVPGAVRRAKVTPTKAVYVAEFSVAVEVG